MARPKKTGLDYFAVDVDMAQDLKVRRMMSRKGGARALGVFVCLLCRIYKNGYYLDYSEDMVFVIASDIYEDEDYVREIILYCLEVGLFDKKLYEESRVLSSHGIQERYIAVQVHYKRISVIGRYNLLDDGESPEVVSSEENGISSEETRVNAEETMDNGNKHGRNRQLGDVSSGFSTQKKKENKNESSSSTAPVREGLETEIEMLVADAVWAESVISRFGLEREALGKYLADFRTDCLVRGKDGHADMEDLKSHFSDWLRIQIGKQSNNSFDYGKSGQTRQTGHRPAVDLRRPAPVSAGARQEDFSGTF